MPIHTDDRDRYPDDWKEIVGRVRERSGGRCECEGECGLHPGRRCIERDGYEAKYARGKVVMTVAHLDHTPETRDLDKLRHMCQRCHLRYDRDHHDETRRRRRRENLEQAGQGRMFEPE